MPDLLENIDNFVATMDFAVLKLPDNWAITIRLERNSETVELRGPCGEIYSNAFTSPEYSLAKAIFEFVLLSWEMEAEAKLKKQ